MMGITKVGVGRFLVGSYLVLEYQKEMEENYRKGDWLEATKDTGFFAVKMLPVVAPAFVFGTLAPVWGGIALGVVTTAVIVEATGIGEWEEVRDLLLEPPNPVEWYETVAPEIGKKSEEFQIAAVAWVDRRLMEGQHYIEAKVKQKKSQLESGWDWVEDNWRWSNPTPGFSW